MKPAEGKVLILLVRIGADGGDDPAGEQQTDEHDHDESSQSLLPLGGWLEVTLVISCTEMVPFAYPREYGYPEEQHE